MATKVTILGQEPTTEKKKIEFVKFLRLDYFFICTENVHPEDYTNIVLLCRNYAHGELDLMLAYDDEHRCLFLGHFNDGVV